MNTRPPLPPFTEETARQKVQAAEDARAGHTDDARARVNEARDLIGTCPAPGILPGLLTETEYQAGQHAPAPAPRPHGRGRRPDGLTAREAQVLTLLATGHRNNEIAAQLVISVRTVERHLYNAYRKLGVRNRAGAAAYIVRSDCHRRAAQTAECSRSVPGIPDDCSGIRHP